MDTKVSHPVNSPDLPKKSVLPILGVLSGVTGLTTFAGMATSKLIAMYAGAEGIASLGLYRSFAAAVGSALSLGYLTVFMQSSIRSTSPKEISRLFSAATLLLSLQLLVMGAGILIFRSTFFSWFVGKSVGEQELNNFLIVALMAVSGICVQILFSIFKGTGDIRRLTTTQLIISFGNLILIIPLLKLGSQGIAISVGASSIVASSYGLSVLWKRSSRKLTPFEIVKDGFDLLRSKFGASSIFLVHALATSFGIFGMQSLIGRYYGLDVLGNFNATYLLIDTGLMILIGSPRSYFFSALGNAKSDVERRAIIDQMLSVFLTINTIFCVFLIVFSDILIQILYTRSFDRAGTFLAISSLCFINSSFSWTYNTLFLERKYNFTVTILDSFWILLLLLGNFVASGISPNPAGCAVVWVVAGFVSTLGYTLAAYFHSKGSLLILSKVRLLAMSCLICSFFLAGKFTISFYGRIALWALGFALLIYFVKSQHFWKDQLLLLFSRRTWLENPNPSH